MRESSRWWSSELVFGKMDKLAASAGLTFGQDPECSSRSEGRRAVLVERTGEDQRARVGCQGELVKLRTRECPGVIRETGARSEVN